MHRATVRDYEYQICAFAMYQAEVDYIEYAIKLISVSDNQYEYGEVRTIGNKEQNSLRKRTTNHSVCDVCGETVDASLDLPTYLPDGTPLCSGDIIWKQTICPGLIHIDDRTPICHGCMRFKTSDATYINLGDGREICSDCHSTAIFGVQECEPLVRECHEFFATLEMEVPEVFQVFLVDTKEMARVCCEPESPMVYGVGFEAEDDGLGPISTVTRCSLKENSIVMEQQSHEDFECGIAILFGMPRIMTQAVLAHEMTHVWFKSKVVKALDKKLKEGMCQVIARKLLDWVDGEIASLSSTTSDHEQAQFLRNLVDVYKYVVEMHSSEEYGDGFREVQWAVARFGLQKTFDRMITSGKLPEE